MIRRPPRSTRVRSSAASDVYKRQVLTMAYAIGHISGCHLNPAVSVGLVVGKRFPAKDLLPYIVAQVLGAIAGAGILFIIASGKDGFSTAGGFASNGYGVHSPGGYSMVAC